MDVNLKQATSDLITTRVNFHGRRETDVVSDAFAELKAKIESLNEKLDENQQLLLRAVENAVTAVIGENSRYYYKAGFGDAIGFVIGWVEHQNI